MRETPSIQPLVDDSLLTDARRGLAFLLDIGLLLVVGLALSHNELPFVHEDSWYFLVLLLAVANLVLLPVFGITIGKLLFGLRIVDERGRAPGLRTAIGRSFFPGAIWVILLLLAPQRHSVWEADAFDTLLWLALLFALFATFPDTISWLSDPNHRALHDFNAGTWVVLARNVPSGSWALDLRQLYRDFGRRSAALLLDLALFWAGWSVVDRLLMPRLDPDWRPIVLIAGILLYWVGLVAYGVTPGSWLLGLRIVHARDGRRPGLVAAARRAIIYSPILLLIWLRSSRMDYTMEASERLQSVSDLLLLAVIAITVVDAATALTRGRPLHDLRSETTVVSRADTA